MQSDTTLLPCFHVPDPAKQIAFVYAVKDEYQYEAAFLLLEERGTPLGEEYFNYLHDKAIKASQFEELAAPPPFIDEIQGLTCFKVILDIDEKVVNYFIEQGMIEIDTMHNLPGIRDVIPSGAFAGFTTINAADNGAKLPSVVHSKQPTAGTSGGRAPRVDAESRGVTGRVVESDHADPGTSSDLTPVRSSEERRHDANDTDHGTDDDYKPVRAPARKRNPPSNTRRAKKAKVPAEPPEIKIFNGEQVVGYGYSQNKRRKDENAPVSTGLRTLDGKKTVIVKSDGKHFHRSANYIRWDNLEELDYLWELLKRQCFWDDRQGVAKTLNEWRAARELILRTDTSIAAKISKSYSKKIDAWVRERRKALGLVQEKKKRGPKAKFVSDDEE